MPIDDRVIMHVAYVRPLLMAQSMSAMDECYPQFANKSTVEAATTSMHPQSGTDDVNAERDMDWEDRSTVGYCAMMCDPHEPNNPNSCPMCFDCAK